MLYKHNNILVNICFTTTRKQIIINGPGNAQQYFPDFFFFFLYICCLSDDAGVTSICSVLPVLSKMMTGNNIKAEFQLLPCLGLEKEASGALLLAKRAEVLENVLSLQRNKEVQMTYWYGKMETGHCDSFISCHNNEKRKTVNT